MAQTKAVANTTTKDVAPQAQPQQRPSAVAQMASRLGCSAQMLMDTLKGTVFKNAKDHEFAALMMVANEYRLNPFTKEIYAFPAKGGGIVPIVSIDGWIRMVNEHPAFDGVEQEFIEDESGKLVACETIMWRKDRSRPIKSMEYLVECYRKTEPWDQMPHRMLGHKSYIQCARYAFGFAGISDPDDGHLINLTPEYTPPPTREQSRQIEDNYDPETGEVIEEEQAEEVDLPTDEQTGQTVDPRAAKFDEIVSRAKAVETLIDYNSLAAEMQPHIDAMTDEDMAGAANAALKKAKDRLTGRGSNG